MTVIDSITHRILVDHRFVIVTNRIIREHAKILGLVDLFVNDLWSQCYKTSNHNRTRRTTHYYTRRQVLKCRKLDGRVPDIGVGKFRPNLGRRHLRTLFKQLS